MTALSSDHDPATGARADLAARPAGARSIVMVGMMGAGKTAVGRRLAARLGWHFVDADQAIEEAAGLPIEEIFARHGEPHFRSGERNVIARLLAEGPMVLATGGGAYMDPDTRARIAASGLSVWLRANVETLVRRTGRRTDRPFLKAGDRRETIARLVAQRYPVYAGADIVVDTDDGPPEETVERVLAALAGHGIPPARETLR
ncbi:MAG: shikimate kinase [Alphaproteobacteria bacterium]|nr:shikimate kinase [Alphaproteobacteria bacterium]